ncbi:MAG: hypothetical protein JST20_02885 [Bacteroidetes bacterium]|nr:hypothetical protein [Bacteroidota bacterium]
MKTLNIFIFSLLCFTISASAVEINSNQFLNFNIKSSTSKVPTTLTTVAKEFNVNTNAFASVFKSSYPTITLTEFPISKSETATLFLVQARSVVDARTEWYVGSKRASIPDVVAYRGVIVGEPNSKVLINYANGDMMGCIIRGSGEQLTISPYGNSVSTERLHTVAPELAISQQNGNLPFNCATDESGAALVVPKVSVKKDKSVELILSKQPLEVEVIVETTTGFFTGPGGGNEAKAGAYIVSLYNMVSLIYEDEMNLTYRIIKTQIWTKDDPDGYKNSDPNTGDNRLLKDEFVNRWKIRTTTPRDLVNLLSRPGGTRVLGIANGIGGICNNTDGSVSGYAVCGIQGFTNIPTLSYSEEVTTIAHENGHVMGAAHTHNCVWNPPLDSCTTSNDPNSNFYSDACNTGNPIYNTGSIMSYCHLWGRGVPMTFLPRVYDFLRQNMETKSCLTEPATSIVKVQYPLGNQSFKAGEVTQVRWTTSSTIKNVKIEFSSNEGASWSVIPNGDNVNSQLGGRDYGQGTIVWKVPAVNTTKGLIRVSDASNPAIFAITLAPFTIKSASLTLEYPKGGEKFGQSEKFDVQWNASLVNEVKVEFTSNGGNTWDVLSSNSGSSFSFDVPDIETNQGRFRISDASNNELISESGTFSIGKEKLFLRTPNGGDVICSNKDFTIQWYTDFMSPNNSKVKIYYSIDDGAKWNSITNIVGTEATAGTYVWSGTKPASTNAKVLIVYRNDTSVNVISEKSFTIDASSACQPIGVNEPVVSTNFANLTVSPNPISTQGIATVEFPMPCGNIECTLVDIKGSFIAKFGSFNSNTLGKQEIHFDVSTISSGTYFLTLKCGSQSVAAPITISR